MAKKTVKKRGKGTGGKRTQQRAKAPAQVQAAPSAKASSPTSPPVGSSSAMIPLDMNNPAVRAEVALLERQSNQKWTGLPAKGKIRRTVAAIMALKITEGLSGEEIAQRLGIKPATVRQYIWIAGKNGWLHTADPHEQAENVLVHRAVSNLEELLHSRNSVTGLPDKEVTLETVKGLGIFKDHSKIEGGNNQQANMLTINVVMPEGAGGNVRPGTIAGKPAYVEGEVVHASSESNPG